MPNLDLLDLVLFFVWLIVIGNLLCALLGKLGEKF